MINDESFRWIWARGRFNNMPPLALKDIDFNFETFWSSPSINFHKIKTWRAPVFVVWNWLKGNKSTSRVTTADHNCVRVRFAASTVIRNGAVVFKMESWEISEFLRSKMNRWRLLFMICHSKTLSQFLQQALRKVWCINSTQQQKKSKCANVETNRRDKRALDSFHRFFKMKWERVTADWRSQMQACFGGQRGTFWMQNSKTCYIVNILR